MKSLVQFIKEARREIPKTIYVIIDNKTKPFKLEYDDSINNGTWEVSEFSKWREGYVKKNSYDNPRGVSAVYFPRAYTNYEKLMPAIIYWKDDTKNGDTGKQYAVATFDPEIEDNPNKFGKAFDDKTWKELNKCVREIRAQTREACHLQREYGKKWSDPELRPMSQKIDSCKKKIEDIYLNCPLTQPKNPNKKLEFF